MSSVLAFVRLARRYTVRARRDEAHARGLLEGRAEDATPDQPIELLDLPRSLDGALDALDAEGAEQLADLLHVAVRGHFRGRVEALEVEWLCPGLDTGYGFPSVLAEASVARIAVELDAVAAALGASSRWAGHLDDLRRFYRAAAEAGQVVIVAEL